MSCAVASGLAFTISVTFSPSQVSATAVTFAVHFSQFTTMACDSQVRGMYCKSQGGRVYKSTVRIVAILAILTIHTRHMGPTEHTIVLTA